MQQRIVNEIRDRAIEGCNSVSCESILLNSGITYARQGVQLYCFCPYCDRDKFLLDLQEARENKKPRTFSKSDISDHFSVNISKNKFFCFTCSSTTDERGRKRSAGGGSAKLYSLLNGIPYIDSALMLAVSMGAITEEEMKIASSSPDAIAKFKKGLEAIEAFDTSVAMREAEVKAPAQVCNLVYSAMITMPEFTLDSNHLNYLLNNRFLSLEQIKEMQFFTYSKKFNIDNLIKRIQSVVPNFTYNHLYGVPGFFFESFNDGKGVWRFKSPMPNCIGIPLRNNKGEIVALQMRNMDKNAKSKYFYVSSVNESSKNKAYGYGSSPSTPVAVVYPEFLRLPTFYVGEGIFKMIEIAREGVVAFSVQGVNALSHVANEIKEVMKGQKIRNIPTCLSGEQESKIVIVFDADMYSKVQVLEASLKASVYFSEQFPGKQIYFLLWKEEYGKGFDDMKFYCLQNNIDYHQKVRAISKDFFIQKTEDALHQSDNEFIEKYGTMEVADRKNKEYGEILYRNLYLNKILPILP